MATATPDPSVHDRAVANVYALARHRKEGALLDLGVTVTTPTPVASATRASDGPIVLATPANSSSSGPATIVPSVRASAPASGDGLGALRSAVALALYVIDRKRYADNFVADYPVDKGGVTNDYGSDLVSAHLTPSGAAFPVAAIATLALAGDREAYQKLLLAAAVAQGGLAATYRTQLGHVVNAATPQETFEAIGSLSPGEQLASIATIDWCRRPVEALLAYRPAQQSTVATATPQPGAAMQFAARVRFLQSAIAQSATADCRVSSTRVRVRPVPESEQ